MEEHLHPVLLDLELLHRQTCVFSERFTTTDNSLNILLLRGLYLVNDLLHAALCPSRCLRLFQTIPSFLLSLELSGHFVLDCIDPGDSENMRGVAVLVEGHFAVHGQFLRHVIFDWFRDSRQLLRECSFGCQGEVELFGRSVASGVHFLVEDL